MNGKDKISRTARQFRRLLMVIFAAIPLIHAFIWIAMERFPSNIMTPDINYEIVGHLTPTVRILAFFVSMIQGGIAMYGIYLLIGLFRLYESGDVFKPANVRCFRGLSRVLIWWTVGGILTDPLQSLVLTLNNPPGKHILEIGLVSADFTALVVGGLLAVIAWVMEEGRKLQEEQELTV